MRMSAGSAPLLLFVYLLSWQATCAFVVRPTRTPYFAITEPLHMAAKGGDKGTFVSSVFQKEIAYDETSGRFFETDVTGGVQEAPDTETIEASAAAGKKDPDAVTKASWYAVEAFGKLFGQAKQSKAAPATDQPPSSVQETQQRIQLDNEREYFLSGEIDELIYDEECTFADPFVSFQGRDRFVENLANLGSFITEYSAKPLSYDVGDDNAVTTKFMVKLQLNLPWKPVLAWPWGVRCEIDPETCLITLHGESVRRWKLPTRLENVLRTLARHSKLSYSFPCSFLFLCLVLIHIIHMTTVGH